MSGCERRSKHRINGTLDFVGQVIKALCCSNAVMRFRHSSYYLGQSLASQGKTLQEKYLVSEQDYVVHGGAFPLIIKGVGIIGTVTVSGLAQQVSKFPDYSAASWAAFSTAEVECVVH